MIQREESESPEIINDVWEFDDDEDGVKIRKLTVLLDYL